RAGRAIFVLEASAPPPDPLVEQIADDCDLAPKDLTFIYAPTSSLVGSVQIVARVLEVAMHKAHTLKFPLDRIVDGLGAAPLSPPPAPASGRLRAARQPRWGGGGGGARGRGARPHAPAPPPPPPRRRAAAGGGAPPFAPPPPFSPPRNSERRPRPTSSQVN